MILKADTKQLADSEIQLIRESSLGASDMAWAMLGNSVDVALRKMKLIPQPEKNLKMELGLELESFVANQVGRQLAERYPGADIKIDKADAIYEHEERSYLTCSPDFWLVVNHPGFEFSGQLGVIETKTASGKRALDAWDVGPADYAHWQTLDQLEVLGPEVSFAVAGALIFVGTEPQVRHHVVTKDLEAVDMLLNRAGKIWEWVNIRAIPDVELQTLETVKAVYTQAASGKVIELPAPSVSLAGEYVRLRADIGAMKKRKDAIQARLCALLKDAVQGRSESCTVSWAASQRMTFDEERFRADYPDLYTKYFNASKQRRFSVNIEDLSDDND